MPTVLAIFSLLLALTPVYASPIDGRDTQSPNGVTNRVATPTKRSDPDVPGVTVQNDDDASGSPSASASGSPQGSPSSSSPDSVTSGQLLAWASYTNPLGDPAAWDRLISYDTSKLSIVVANVLNGPDYKIDQSWASVIQKAAGAGKTVLGYVRTGYLGVSSQKFKTRLGSSDLADWASQIEQDVDKWFELYGSSMGGIFFDEGWPECGPNNIYSDLYAYINAYTKRKHPGAYTVLNPGSPMAQCFEDTMDTLLTFEASYEAYQPDKFVPNAWTPKDDRKIWHIIYNVPQDKIQEVAALSRQRHAGYIEITDENNTPNPYDKVPADSYMQTVMGAISGGQVQSGSAKALGASYLAGFPADSQVTASDYTSVTLTWSPVSDALGYGVYKNDALVLELPPSLTRATVGMLDPGVSSIRFEVRTVLDSGAQGSPIILTADTKSLPSDGSISNVKFTKNADGTVTYNADVLVPYAFVRLFIAGPHKQYDASAGWPMPAGTRTLPWADQATIYKLVTYLVEGNDFYSGFFNYTGQFVEGSSKPADWTWTPSGTAPQSQSGYTYTWTVPLVGTDAQPEQFVVQGQGYAPVQNIFLGSMRTNSCEQGHAYCDV